MADIMVDMVAVAKSMVMNTVESAVDSSTLHMIVANFD